MSAKTKDVEADDREPLVAGQGDVPKVRSSVTGFLSNSSGFAIVLGSRALNEHGIALRQVQSGMTHNELVSGSAYCLSSVGMVLVNKAALSSFGFQCPNSLLLYQCLIALVMVQAAHFMKLVTVERLQWNIVQVWLPVNVIFVGMLWTGNQQYTHQSPVSVHSGTSLQEQCRSSS